MKKKNCQHFSPFLSLFFFFFLVSFQKQISFLVVFSLLHANASNLDQSIILMCGKLLTTHSQILTNLKKKPFENIVRKGENAGNQHFLLFLQCFQPFPRKIAIFELHLFCHQQIFSVWNGLKFCCLVKS